MATARIYKIADELSRRRTIPTAFHATLEERFPIACNPLSGPLSRGKALRTTRESRLHFQRRRANRVYSEILDEDPDILLPFIIAISPRRCESFDSSDFLDNHKKKKKKLNLTNEVESHLEEIAQKTGISQSLSYKRLIQELFPKQLSPPTTGAESDTHWKYHAATLDAISSIFGKYIRDAIEGAPMRILERARSESIQITECVRMNIPQKSFQDSLIWVDIGPALDLAKSLFPSSRYMAIPSPGDGYEEMVGSGLDIDDHAYYSLQGASVSAILTVFGNRIWDAVEKSELRTWEKQHLLIDTTDCVKMQMSRKKPHLGVVCLRTEFSIGIHIADNLYADSGIA